VIHASRSVTFPSPADPPHLANSRKKEGARGSSLPCCAFSSYPRRMIDFPAGFKAPFVRPSGRIEDQLPPYFIPVLPKPTVPRVVTGSSVTSRHVARTSSASTACAMRMPRSMVKGSLPAFIKMTCNSPR